MNDDRTTTNALHAARIWLERMGAAPDSVAVVQIQPTAAVGVYAPGQLHVGMLPTIDDTAAELCEAVAPMVKEALGRLDQRQVEAIAGAVGRGAVLQALVQPAMQQAELRLLSGRSAVPIITVMLDQPTH